MGGSKVLRGALKVILRALGCGSASLVTSVCARITNETSFVISVPHSHGTTIGPMLFRPLTLIRLRTSFHPGTAVCGIGRTGSLCPFTALPCSPCGSTVTLFLSRFLCHTIQRRTRGHPLFTCLCRSIV